MVAREMGVVDDHLDGLEVRLARVIEESRHIRLERRIDPTHPIYQQAHNINVMRMYECERENE